MMSSGDGWRMMMERGRRRKRDLWNGLVTGEAANGLKAGGDPVVVRGGGLFGACVEREILLAGVATWTCGVGSTW